MIIAPKDATGCFDLLRVEQIRTIQKSKGMPRGINACRIKVLHGMEERHVKTAGKVSKGSFKYTLENKIGGIGQGPGSGTQDGNDDIGLIKDVYHADTTPGFTFQHPSGEKEEEDTRHGQGFIDDQIDVTALDTSNDAATSLPQCQQSQQIWQNLLNVTGGDLSLTKCSFGWYIAIQIPIP